MAKIVIKKRVSLEFLGEEHKEDYLVFRSMPLKDYEAFLPKLEAAADNGAESIKLIKELLETNFIEGKFQDESVAKEDLGDFDIATLTKSFEYFTGQVTDPKA